MATAMARRQLSGLKPQSYEHPLDKKALDALQKTGGLETLVRKVNEWGFERVLRMQLTGSHLQVGADSFPEIHALTREAAANIDLPSMPDVYIAAGVQQCLQWIDSGDYDRLLAADHQGPRPMIGAAFCTSCGAKLAASAQFCSGCGLQLRAAG